MDEEESIFDPSLKKKKKKKTGFNLEAALAEGTKFTEGAPEGENGEAGSPGLKKKKKKSGFDLDDEDKKKSEEKTDDATTEKDDDADTEFFGKKKSSKKKKAFNFDDLNEALDVTGAEEGGDGQGESAAPDIDMDLEFNFSSKKKKKKGKLMDIGKLIADDAKEKTDGDEKEKEEAWGDSERDYSYDELLQRAFDLLREKNPEMAAGEKKKFIMKPPHVLRIGSKKSAFANFSEICKLLHRMPNHVLQFLLAELGTSGSIDGNCQLIIKGRFQQKQIENVLRRYIKEYVTCHTCRSSDTILQKDARLYFLQCEQCNSRCSVAPIKSGFQAVANKQQRQAIRASKD